MSKTRTLESYTPVNKAGDTITGRTIIRDDVNADHTYPLGIQNQSQQPWYFRALETSNKLSLHLNGFGDALLVDNGGRVSIPNNPAWSGSMPGQFGGDVSVPGSPTKITSLETHFNINNCWSSANSRFTASVQGTYLVTYFLMKNQGNGQVVHVDLYKNGADMGQSRLRANATGDYVQAGQAYTVYLNVNDYLEFVWFGGCNVYTGHDSFSITFLG